MSFAHVEMLINQPERTEISLEEALQLFANSGLPETEKETFLTECGYAHAVITFCNGTYKPGQQLR